MGFLKRKNAVICYAAQNNMPKNRRRSPYTQWEASSLIKIVLLSAPTTSYCTCVNETTNNKRHGGQ